MSAFRLVSDGKRETQVLLQQVWPFESIVTASSIQVGGQSLFIYTWKKRFRLMEVSHPFSFLLVLVSPSRTTSTNTPFFKCYNPLKACCESRFHRFQFSTLVITLCCLPGHQVRPVVFGVRHQPPAAFVKLYGPALSVGVYP